MVARASIRASDRDREQVAERLRHAAAEGRLLAEELEHRLARALRAKTYGELDPLVSDLPGHRSALERRPSLSPVTVLVAMAAVVVVATLTAVVLILFAGLLAIWAIWMLAAWWIVGPGRRVGLGFRARRPRRGGERRPPLRYGVRSPLGCAHRRMLL